MPTFEAHSCSPHPSAVEPYRAYLEERWQQGEVMIKTRLPTMTKARVYGELQKCLDIRAQLVPSGRDDSYVFIFLCSCLDSSGCSCHPNAIAGEMAGIAQAGELNAQDAAYRQALFRLSPHLSSLSALGQDFVRLIRERKSEALLPWLERAKGGPYEELQRFAQGLERELPAVQAALTEPWRAGQVEGQITRLKLLKRQMDGRANLDLLRLRVLHVA